MITKIVIGFDGYGLAGIGFGRVDASAVELSAVVVGLSQNSRTGSPTRQRDQYTLDAFKQMVAV